MVEYIPMDSCKHSYLYKIDARNFSLGVYNMSIKGFLGIREKWGSRFIETEGHWDTGEPHGTVKPLKLLEKYPNDIDNEVKLFKWLEENGG